MAKIKYKKSELAVIQLKKSILLFAEKDHICSLSLAGAANGILEDLCRARGKPFSVTLPVEKVTFKEGDYVTNKNLKTAQNKTVNELKHSKVKDDISIEEDFSVEAEMMIKSAAENYKNLFGAFPNDTVITDFMK